jgi:hypothetical protein
MERVMKERTVILRKLRGGALERSDASTGIILRKLRGEALEGS